MNKMIKRNIIIGLLAMLLIVNISYAQDPTEICINTVSAWVADLYGLASDAVEAYMWEKAEDVLWWIVTLLPFIIT